MLIFILHKDRSELRTEGRERRGKGKKEERG